MLIQWSFQKSLEEMAHTEDYFKIAIELELEKINNNNNPDAQKILKSALSKLSELENNYNSLKKDLVYSGTDKRVIHAMVQKPSKIAWIYLKMFNFNLMK